MARTIYLIVYNSRLFPAHWAIWIPSQSDPDIGRIINAAGDVLTGFDITFERNYDITAETRPHQVISLGQVGDGDVIDVPGDGSHRVESESQGDLVAWDSIEEAGLSTPAPVKSLRPVSSVCHFFYSFLLWLGLMSLNHSRHTLELNSGTAKHGFSRLWRSWCSVVSCMSLLLRQCETRRKTRCEDKRLLDRIANWFMWQLLMMGDE